MARDALRVTGLNLCDGEILWSAAEVLEVKTKAPQKENRQESQSGRVSLLRVGLSHQIFTITFRVEFRDTIEKLMALRDLRTSFTVYPFWAVDPITSFEVVWINSGELEEVWWRGLPKARYDVDVTWEEVIAGVCGPLSS
jgi:hypothetical protein